jgi:tetratricopeptide (TPR) repeat protein
VSSPVPFAARSEALARVTDGLSGRRARGVVISGASGAGCTRLAVEAARRAEADGATTVFVHGGADAQDEPLRPLLVAATTVIAPGEDPTVAIHRWAAELAKHERLVIVADDVHRLPHAAAQLVAELGRLHVLLATAPTSAVLPEPIDALRRAGRLADVVLDPLDEADVAVLAEARLGGPIDRRSAHELHRRWGGNVRHTLAQLDEAIDRGAFAESLGLWRLVHDWGTPVSTVAEVEARVAGLDADERKVIELLSVAGHLGLDLLDRLASAAAVRALDDGGWLSVEQAGHRRLVALTDPSVATVIADRMPTLRANATADAVLDALDDAGWRRADDPVLRSVLLARSGRRLTAVEMLEAARVARFGRRLDVAEQMARRSHDAGGGWEAAYLLGEVLEERGRRVEADRFYMGYAATTISPDEKALVAMATAVNRYYGLNRRDEAEVELSTALEELRGTRWEAELECLLAVFAMFRGQVDEAIAVGRRHQHTADDRGRIEAATVLAPALAVAGRGDEAIHIAHQASDARQALGPQYVLADYGLHLVAMANAQLEAGRIGDALTFSELIVDASVTYGDREGQAWGDLVVGRCRCLTGDLAGAVEALREAAVLFTDLGFGAQLRWARGSMAMALAYAGDASGAVDAGAQLDLVNSGWGFMEAEMIRAQAWVTASTGDLSHARHGLLDAAALGETTLHLTSRARALHDLVRLGEPRGPAEELDDLVAGIDGPLAPLLSAHRHALAAGDPDALLAVAHDLADASIGTYAAEAA